MQALTALIRPKPRAWYSAPIPAFIATQTSRILGELTQANQHELGIEQRNVWEEEIEILKFALAKFEGWLHLEFTIPRIGHRVDAVVVAGPAIYVLEFKLGDQKITQEARNQVWDYALDLKNFHQSSHKPPIIPLLINPQISTRDWALLADTDQVHRPLLVNCDQLREVLERCQAEIQGETIDPQKWQAAPYQPTPNIIEAARALYQGHTVAEIARDDTDTAQTTACLWEIIQRTRNAGEKAICFITGVPGAGKTLVGLDISTKPLDPSSETGIRPGKREHAVFLSGNGPLVAVLTEALARDEIVRLEQKGESERIGNARRRVKAFIQNVHRYRDEYRELNQAPPEHVAIFDEAQRAWTQARLQPWMARRKRVPNFHYSEPEFLIACMDQRPDWATIVCLVGGGQEINQGEAGIGLWLEAILNHYPDWNMYVSKRLRHHEYFLNQQNQNSMSTEELWQRLELRPRTTFEPNLHLAVSMRSFRAEKVSEFVDALLALDQARAKNAHEAIAAQYPIALTRDLQMARNWLRQQARGSDRYGLVASSKAYRLKPHAIDIRVDVDPVHWFLDGRSDTRSSYYLEDAATEFQVQGLELDWTCITWDGDLRYHREGWHKHAFTGEKWTHIRNADRQKYLLNAYRVLLTRARQGMVICVPHGNEQDPTRKREIYDPTFEYLCSLGLPQIN